MTQAARFFSCLQTGLGATLDQRADENGVPPSALANLTPRLRIAGINRDFSQVLSLRAPGDVMRLASGAVRSQEPKSDARDVAPNFFPYVELVDAAMPWAFTPARPHDNGRLMPWLVLVVVPKGDQISLTKLANVPGMALSISGGAGSLLPKLQEAFAWAHVEDRSGAENAAEAFATRPSDFVARLMCPVRMAKNTAYIACLVPAFEAGRQAGLGRDVTEASGALAWEDNTDTLDLPAFHHWEFTTGADDFEALVRRLRGVPVDDSVGLHDLDISDPKGGLGVGQVMGQKHAKDTILVSYRGALTSPVAAPREWAAKHREPFQDRLFKSLTPIITAPVAQSKYNANDHDPVITAPIYGSFQKDARLFENGTARWMREANLDPQYRANAGLGTRIVRRHQETLMAKAWARAKGIDEVNSYLRRMRVALSVGTQMHARLSRLPAPQYVQITTAVQASIPAQEGKTLTLADKIARSETMPAGVFTPTFRRASAITHSRVKSLPRPDISTSIQRQVTQTSLSGQAITLAERLPDLDLGAKVYTQYKFGSVDLSPSLSLEALALQVGIEMKPTKGLAIGTVLTDAGLKSNPKAVAKIASILGSITPKSLTVTTAARAVIAIDAAAIKQTIAKATLPSTVLSDLTQARVTGLAKPPAKQLEIPRRALLTVSFDEPASAFLTTSGAEFLLPGFGTIADHSVSLLVTNSAFVESFLLGLNHELSREFAWRQFPAALDGTWFQRFWNYLGAQPRNDITPIKDWPNGRRLGVGTSTDDAVILVKSPLFKRYPETLVYAVPAKWMPQSKLKTSDAQVLKRTEPMTGGPAVRVADFSKTDAILTPSFSGRLSGSAAFFGFSTDPLALVGTPTPQNGQGDPGFFIVFEQAPGNKKFGLDQPDSFTPNQAPASADALSWGHFAASQTELDQPGHATIAPNWASSPVDGAYWGATAADTAKLALQSPVRIMFHASGLMSLAGGAT